MDGGRQSLEQLEQRRWRSCVMCHVSDYQVPGEVAFSSLTIKSAALKQEMRGNQRS